MSLDERTVLYIVISFLVGLLVKSFLPGYFKKKGENLATKEDIEAITAKIESVRSSITISAEAHKSYLSDRKSCLMRFYDEISTFNYELMAVNFGDFPMDGGKSLFEYQNRFHASVAEVLKSYQRLVVYLPSDSRLLDVARKIANIVIEARKILKRNFGAIKYTVVKEEEAYTEYKSILSQDRSRYDAAVDAANEANNRYWGLMKPLAESFLEQYQIYIIELNSYFGESELNG